VLVVGLLGGTAVTSSASADPCGVAIAMAAKRTGVPHGILRAIGRIESGISFRGQIYSWPWAVNDNGRSLLFKTREAASRYVAEQVEAGRLSIDIGCLQINWRWHGAGFRHPDELFEPTTNALYGAVFLNELYRETGSWAGAVSAYHSRAEANAARYRCAVAKAIQGRPANDCMKRPPPSTASVPTLEVTSASALPTP
jgi:hypothetical protein